MGTHFMAFWDGLRENYWFVPLLMALGSLAVRSLTLAIDSNTDELRELGMPFLYGGGPVEAREILSTVAGSIITVSGLGISR
jgi:uncharacterized membrane protein